MKRPHPMGIVIGALTVVAVVLLVWGIATHDERTFQRACATPPSGIADYTGDCFEVRWPALPVSVSSNGNTDQQRVLLRALSAMNRELRMHAVRRAKDGEEAQAFVLFNVAPWAAMPHAGATTTHYFSGNVAVRAEVRVVNVVFAQSLDAIVRHELGHVLGLADEDYAGVLMSVPTLPGKPLSDYDVRALREAYPAARY